jgi:hypothetical protein
MRALFLVVTFLFVASLGGASVGAQSPQLSPVVQSDPEITPNGVIGEVKGIDAGTRQLIVKTDKGSSVTVTLTEKTNYLRLPPGEKTLANAIKIGLADVGEGDRVWARGKVTEDHKSVPAMALVVMTKADLAKKQEVERLEWRRRGILGVISAIKPDAKEITISTRAAAGPQPVIIPVSDKLEIKRYAPDSIKFSDAKTSAFEELKVGDQVRALGERSADGTHFTAERLVTGSFRTVAGTVTAVDATSGEIRINDLEKKQPLTILIKGDSVLRKFPAQSAMGGMMMGRGAGGGAPGGPGGGAAQSQGGERPANGGAPAAGGGPGARPGGGPGTGQGGGRFNVQDMLERLPTIAVADIKVGDVILVSSTKGADPTRLTAITLVSGADTLLTMLAPRPQPGAAQQTPNPAAGLGSGVTFGIGLP